MLLSEEMPDYSGWQQPDPNYEALAAAGAWGVLEKATEGGTIMGTFPRRWAAMRAAQARHPNFRIGCYCFARPGDGSAEARLILQAMASSGGIAANAIIDYDVEVNGIWQSQINAFHATIQAASPVPLERWQYEGAYFGPENGHYIPGGVKWHVPAYGPSWPKWGTYNPVAWQFSNVGVTPGWNGQCDLSVVYEANKPTPQPRPVHPAHYAQVGALQKCLVGVDTDGVWGPRTDTAFLYLRAGQACGDVLTLQRYLGFGPDRAHGLDGAWGPNTAAREAAHVKCFQAALGLTGVYVDGVWGPVTERFYEAARVRYRVG